MIIHHWGSIARLYIFHEPSNCYILLFYSNGRYASHDCGYLDWWILRNIFVVEWNRGQSPQGVVDFAALDSSRSMKNSSEAISIVIWYPCIKGHGSPPVNNGCSQMTFTQSVPGMLSVFWLTKVVASLPNLNGVLAQGIKRATAMRPGSYGGLLFCFRSILLTGGLTLLVWAANHMRLDRPWSSDRKSRIAAIFF